MGVFLISKFLVFLFLNKNYHNSRTSDNIDMKLGSVTNLDKRNKTTSKNLMMRRCQKIVTPLSFFQFMVNLVSSKGWSPDAQSVRLTFSIKVTLCFTKNENRTKKSLIQLSHYCFEQSYYFCQKIHIFCKKTCSHEQN